MVSKLTIIISTVGATLALFGGIPFAIADQNPYDFTVNVPSHAFGAHAITIFVKN